MKCSELIATGDDGGDKERQNQRFITTFRVFRKRQKKRRIDAFDDSLELNCHPMIQHVRPQLGRPIVNSIHGESDVNSIAAGRLAGKAA